MTERLNSSEGENTKEQLLRAALTRYFLGLNFSLASINALRTDQLVQVYLSNAEAAGAFNPILSLQQLTGEERKRQSLNDRPITPTLFENLTQEPFSGQFIPEAPLEKIRGVQLDGSFESVLRFQPIQEEAPSRRFGEPPLILSSREVEETRAERVQEKLNARPLANLRRLIEERPDLMAKVQPFVDAEAQLLAGTFIGFGLYKRDSAFWAGVLADPETAALFDLALLDAVTAESNALKEYLKSGEEVLPLVHLGAGFAGQAFAGTVMHFSPDVLPVLVDRRPRPGGQFYAADGPVHPLNSAQRPFDVTAPNLPGNRGDILNSGPHSYLHTSLVTGARYPSQIDFGRVLALNAYLQGLCLLETEILKVEETPFEDNGVRLLKVTALDVSPEEPEEFEFFVSTLIDGGGRGRPNYGIQPLGEQEQKVLEYSDTEEARGGTRYVYNAEQAFAYLADPRNRKKLSRLGQRGPIVLVGDIGADTMKVMINRLTGLYSSGDTDEPVSLKFPEVVVVTPRVQNRDEFCASERPLYTPAATNLPADGLRRPPRITQIRGRMTGFRYDPLRDQVKLETTSTVEVTGGTVILCTGQETSDKDKPYASLPKGRSIARRTFLGSVDMAIGTQINGTRVWYSGATNNFPIEPELKQFFPARVADSIKENRASTWVNEPRIGLLAWELLQRGEIPVQSEDYAALLRIWRTTDRATVATRPLRSTRDGALNMAQLSPDRDLPGTVGDITLLAYYLGTAFGGVPFGSRFRGPVEFALENNGGTRVRVLSRTRFSEEIQQVLEDLFCQEDLMLLARRYARTPGTGIRVLLPVENGCIDTTSPVVMKTKADKKGKFSR